MLSASAEAKQTEPLSRLPYSMGPALWLPVVHKDCHRCLRSGADYAQIVTMRCINGRAYCIQPPECGRLAPELQRKHRALQQRQLEVRSRIIWSFRSRSASMRGMRSSPGWIALLIVMPQAWELITADGIWRDFPGVCMEKILTTFGSTLRPAVWLLR